MFPEPSAFATDHGLIARTEVQSRPGSRKPAAAHGRPATTARTACCALHDKVRTASRDPHHVAPLANNQITVLPRSRAPQRDLDAEELAELRHGVLRASDCVPDCALVLKDLVVVSALKSLVPCDGGYV